MGIKTVGVRFNTGFDKIYSYLTEFDVSVGDTLVVNSPNDGLVCVTVKEVTEGATNKATKFVVDKVDVAANAGQEERHTKRKELLGKLEAKRKAFEELAIFEMLASKDSEVRLILAELKGL